MDFAPRRDPERVKQFEYYFGYSQVCSCRTGNRYKVSRLCSRGDPLKKFFAVLSFLIAVSTVTASDAPADVSQAVFLEPFFPLSENAYYILPGISYDLNLVKDSFLFSAGAKARFGAGPARADGTDIYGLYKNEWRVPSGDANGGTSFYLAGELNAAFGWNMSNFFGRRQFISVSFSCLFEREETGGRVFSKAGRYSPCITVSSEVFELWGSMCFASAGYGTLSYGDIGREGSLLNYVKIGFGMEFKEKKEEMKLYKQQEEEGGEKEEEGETVW